MKKLGIVYGVLTALFMSGCNSSDGSNNSGQSSSAAITTSTSSSSFVGNGIYTDNEHRFMLVDSNRDQYNVLVGDPSNNGYYAIHHTVATENQMKAYGVTSIVGNGEPSSDFNFTATASFTTNSVDIAGFSEGKSMVYSMDKAANSLVLADLAGKYSYGGSSWDIEADGSFVLSYVLNSNSGCNITGNLELKDGIYYNVKNVQVTGCSVDGDYNGVMLTVDHGDTDVIFAVMYNDENFFSAGLPLN